MTASPSIQQAYDLAVEQYQAIGVDVAQALDQLSAVSVSMHCWQGDDVIGFEPDAVALGNGLAVTGNYPGRARNVDELRSDLELAYSLIPGKHRLNLHALYGQFSNAIDRDAIDVQHFQGWVQWAATQGVQLDFNPSFFSHRNARDGFTLAHADRHLRQFWIDHGIACRRIAASIGKAQATPCINNFWVPDGFKDTPASRLAPRERLAASLDEIFSEQLSPQETLDSVECKLFGIGSESYVVGSHEFYLGYAISRNKMLCLDAGHFHPTETIADKISSVLMYLPELMLHVSRGVRWDSDHVVVFNDELQSIMQEIVRGDFLSRVHVGLDFFDASINRVAAWVIGTRNALKALLAALLEPVERLQQLERDGDFTARLAVMEEQKTMPLGAVWNYYCALSHAPVGAEWLDEVRRYELNVMSGRDS
ncbi:MAG: L-rhamnose isomerase [Planctomycetales bacterium]|nr:L-rhamnose isomerase [Planctomycetales bacterium]